MVFFSSRIKWLPLSALNAGVFRKELLTEPGEKVPVSPKDQLVQKILENINRNIDDSDFSMDRMAGDLNMSRAQLFRKVSAVTGYTPNYLLRHIRLKKAASLFNSGQDNVTQVMHQVGFNNHSYFAK